LNTNNGATAERQKTPPGFRRMAPGMLNLVGQRKQKTKRTLPGPHLENIISNKRRKPRRDGKIISTNFELNV
ncbi:MAG: hypothetical protein J7527_17005, partial [Chitinophagaceae bacterium]|nr:hypothetical protein [Chitinophagaceae bacterium]